MIQGCNRGGKSTPSGLTTHKSVGGPDLCPRLDSLEAKQPLETLIIKLSSGKWGCPVDGCNTTCTRRTDVQRHLKKHSNTTVLCQLCGAVLSRVDALKRHQKTCVLQS
ncbi:hypothetical protein BC834DRAFT_589879 [Gloeopeniophorella convolvens]|nr:hypothetical protein BC834DRAFT_589879 [Gloeopeniophorella convolvens]